MYAHPRLNSLKLCLVCILVPEGKTINTCSTDGWRSSNSLLYSVNQSAHIMPLDHFFMDCRSNEWRFSVAFPKLCNWFKRTNQSSKILFLLSNQNRFLRGLHLFSNSWQQWRVFALHSDWLIFFFVVLVNTMTLVFMTAVEKQFCW